MVGNRDDGEEIVQNAWLKIWRHTDRSPIAHPKAYLFKVTKNAAIDFAVRAQRDRKHCISLEALTDGDLADDTVARYEDIRQLVIIAVSLNELPEARRQAFIMNKLEGRTHQEIAERLGISVSMVEKHVVGALLHCRKLLLADDEDGTK